MSADALAAGETADLVVVGGGPVGLVTALRARQAGLDVVVCEPREVPVDKACGEGIMPSGLAGLRAVGVDPPGMPIRGIRYLAGGTRAEATFRAAPGRGVRRTVLHQALSDAAGRTGVGVLHGSVTALTQDDAGVRLRVAARGAAASMITLRARYAVAADGLHSPVRRMLGLDAPVRRHRRYGLRRHVALTPWTDHVEVYWAAAGEAYLTPVAPGLVGVALLSQTRCGFDEQLAGFPELRDRLGAAPAASTVRGAGPFRQRSRARVAGRVLLAGDASGYVDALTGEGLSVGFAQAAAAVDAVLADLPAGYEAAWRRVTNRPAALTAALVDATRVGRVRRSLVPVARALPWAFERAVGAVGGSARGSVVS